MGNQVGEKADSGGGHMAAAERLDHGSLVAELWQRAQQPSIVSKRHSYQAHRRHSRVAGERNMKAPDRTSGYKWTILDNPSKRANGIGAER